MDIPVIVDIISIISSTILSVIAIVISVKTLRQSNHAILESSRASIVFYIDTLTGNQQFLTMKNFGNSTGKILDIKITPELDYRKHPNMPRKDNPVLVNYIGITLAPNQCVKSWFPFDVTDEKSALVTISNTLRRISEK